MEGIAPPLYCLIKLRFFIEGGMSVRQAIACYTHTQSDSFSRIICIWLKIHANSQSTLLIKQKIKSPYQRHILDLLEQGLLGQPILRKLELFEADLTKVYNEEIEEKIKILPIISLIPLLLFIFPSLLILIFGPFLSEMLGGLL